jgi:hypothetical protein
MSSFIQIVIVIRETTCERLAVSASNNSAEEYHSGHDHFALNGSSFREERKRPVTSLVDLILKVKKLCFPREKLARGGRGARLFSVARGSFMVVD